MEVGSSLPHSQQSTTCPFPSQINPFLCPSHFGQAQLVTFLRTKDLPALRYEFLLPQIVLHAHLILLDLRTLWTYPFPKPTKFSELRYRFFPYDHSKCWVSKDAAQLFTRLRITLQIHIEITNGVIQRPKPVPSCTKKAFAICSCRCY